MSYVRHSAVDVVSGATQLISSIPNTNDILATVRGSIVSGGGSDLHKLRPNSDGGANYGGVIHYVNSAAQEGYQGSGNDGLLFSRAGVGNDHNVTMRLVKVGNYWTASVFASQRAQSGGTSEVGNGVVWWNGAGIALTTLLFKWDYTTGAARFTGRVEVWYQE